jgi:3-deoxy-manno-octulosonate cytidylyltransferase (CMP-KDO synthetase)
MKPPHILGIIPARFASSRFPGKILAPIAGKSMIQHTFENASRCPLLDNLIVATDDARIYGHVESFGGRVCYTSPECSTGTDRIAEALQKNINSDLSTAEIIVNIQGDVPFINPHLLEKVIKALQESPDAVMSTAVTPLQPGEESSSSVVKCVLDLQSYALYFSRACIPGGHTLRVQSGAPYYKHIGLYCFRRNFLLQYTRLPPTPLQLAEDLEQLKILEHGFRIKVAIVDEHPIGVDLPEDIHKVETWLCKQNISL